jgi:transcriptional regulator with XRE-family HTH domain
MLSSEARIWVVFGRQVRDARLDRGWSTKKLAERAGVSLGMVYRVESGLPASTTTAARLAGALNRRAELHLIDPRRRDQPPNLAGDVVHSAMGEFEASNLRALGNKVGIDEPYQHYQFAGRADLIAWDEGTRALLHIENRTRFPDFQEMAGAFNGKRAYMAAALGERLGVSSWASETHVVAALWSSEVLHALRLRTASFKALCPDAPDAFADWWSGVPVRRGKSVTLIVLDPRAVGRQRPWVHLDEALVVRPRYRGYAEAAAACA